MGGKYPSWGGGGVRGGGVVGEERNEIHWKRPKLFGFCLTSFHHPSLVNCKSRLYLIYREKKDYDKEIGKESATIAGGGDCTHIR